MLVRREFLASRITAALTGAVDSASGVSKRLIRSRLLRARSIGSAVSQVLACRFGGCIRSRARLHYSPALGVRDNDVFDDFYVERSGRSEEHTSELQSLMRISYAVFCLKKKTIHITTRQVN